MPEERVQRRLAAILMADVVGYSRLMGEDEVGTLSPQGDTARRRARLRANLLHLLAQDAETLG